MQTYWYSVYAIRYTVYMCISFEIGFSIAKKIEIEKMCVRWIGWMFYPISSVLPSFIQALVDLIFMSFSSVCCLCFSTFHFHSDFSTSSCYLFSFLIYYYIVCCFSTSSASKTNCTNFLNIRIPTLRALFIPLRFQLRKHTIHSISPPHNFSSPLPLPIVCWIEFHLTVFANSKSCENLLAKIRKAINCCGSGGDGNGSNGNGYQKVCVLASSTKFVVYTLNFRTIQCKQFLDSILHNIVYTNLSEWMGQSVNISDSRKPFPNGWR